MTPRNNGSRITGFLTVRARRVAAHASLQVVVGGTAIGVLRTNGRGRGLAVFTAPSRRGAQLLPIDPRGRRLSVVGDQGHELLAGEVSDPSTPNGVQCCLDTHGPSGAQRGCDVLLAADCTLAGGTIFGAGRCRPDPCPGAAARSLGGSD